MTDSLQPGAHPDADQLSAFLEGVLPEHERLESLAHLAACERCRQIVFLAQPSQEPAPASAATLLRGPGWFSPLAIFGYAAATFACALLVFFAVRGARAPQRPTPNLVAGVAPPTVPVATVAPPGETASSATAPSVPRVAAKQHEALAVPSHNAASSLPAPQPAASSLSGMAYGRDATATADESTAFAGLPAAPSGIAGGAGSAASMGSGRGSGVGSGSGVGAGVEGAIAGSETRQMDRSLKRAQDSVSSAEAMAPAAAAVPAKTPAEPMSPAPVIAGLPMNGRNYSNDTAESRSETVTVAAASPAVEAEDATLDAITLASLTNVPARKPKIHPLPSKLPSIAVVTNDGRTLAADSGGNLFFSRNGGKRWKPVAPQWSGKVIQLALAAPVSLPSGKSQPGSVQAQPGSGQVMAAEAALAISKASAGTRLFELVTASGARWVSTDGLHWRPE